MIVQRVLMAIPVLLGVTILVFLMVHLIPGDPARIIAGHEASEDQVQAIRTELGLNDPLPEQYIRYMTGIFKGDLGRSLHSRRPVIEDIRERFPITIQLATLAVIVASVTGIVVGVVSAVRRYTWVDHVSMLGALVGISMPVFLIGFLLMWLFALELQIFPSGGVQGTPLDVSWWRYMVLPVITLAWTSTGLIARLTRSSMLESIGQDYVRTAWAKGLAPNKVNYKHALRNSLIPVTTYVGLEFGFLLGGAVVTETIFSLPGLGRFVVHSIQSRDYPVIQASILFMAVVFVFINLLVDILYGFLDPRIRYS